MKFYHLDVTPCSLVDPYQRLGGTVVKIYYTTRRHILEDGIIITCSITSYPEPDKSSPQPHVLFHSDLFLILILL
jgi:hypothetical protein